MHRKYLVKVSLFLALLFHISGIIGIVLNKRMMIMSFIIDASFLAVLFDWVMEPVASKLGYWQWENNNIPNYNYISWIIVSALLLALFRKLNYDRRNIFAVHLFIIQ